MDSKKELLIFLENSLRDYGEIAAFIDATTRDGKSLLIPMQEMMQNEMTKNIGAAIIKQAFEANDVVEYIMISECWMTMRHRDECPDGVIEPPSEAFDRIEVVMATEVTGTTVQTLAWKIIRDERSGDFLSLQEMVDAFPRGPQSRQPDPDGDFHMVGRFTDLIPIAASATQAV